MSSPRSNRSAINKISTVPDHCIEKLGEIPEFNDEFASILAQLEQHCQPAVAERLFDYSEYLYLKMTNELGSEEIALQDRLINLLAKQNVSYEAVMQHLIVQHAFPSIRDLCLKTFKKFLLDDPEFRNKFSEDQRYRPLLSERFIAELSQTEGIELDWDAVKRTPVMEEMVDEALDKVYGFQEPYSNEQKSIIAAAKVLANKDIVLVQLAKAESALSLLKQERLKAVEPIRDAAGKERHTDHKLLSNFLYQWAEDSNYAGVSKLLKVAPPQLILGLFRDGMVLKDKGLRGIDHGEFLHIWQWYILTEANKNQPFLSVEPADLLRWIGRQKDGAAIWDKTFEGDVSAIRHSLFKPDFDARSFRKLNNFLLGDECKKKFPVLSNLMRQRLSKSAGIRTSDMPVEVGSRHFNRK